MLVEIELNKLKIIDLTYFNDKNYFVKNGQQNYLVFQAKNEVFPKKIAKPKKIFHHENLEI